MTGAMNGTCVHKHLVIYTRWHTLRPLTGAHKLAKDKVRQGALSIYNTSKMPKTSQVTVRNHLCQMHHLPLAVIQMKQGDNIYSQVVKQFSSSQLPSLFPPKAQWKQVLRTQSKHVHQLLVTNVMFESLINRWQVRRFLKVLIHSSAQNTLT